MRGGSDVPETAPTAASYPAKANLIGRLPIHITRMSSGRSVKIIKLRDEVKRVSTDTLFFVGGMSCAHREHRLEQLT
jgi:hypothetical protein